MGNELVEQESDGAGRRINPAWERAELVDWCLQQILYLTLLPEPDPSSWSNEDIH